MVQYSNNQYHVYWSKAGQTRKDFRNQRCRGTLLQVMLLDSCTSCIGYPKHTYIVFVSKASILAINSISSHALRFRSHFVLLTIWRTLELILRRGLTAWTSSKFTWAIPHMRRMTNETCIQRKHAMMPTISHGTRFRRDRLYYCLLVFGILCWFLLLVDLWLPLYQSTRKISARLGRRKRRTPLDVEAHDKVIHLS